MASDFFHKDYFIKISGKYGIQKMDFGEADLHSGKEVASVEMDSEEDFKSIMEQCKMLYKNLKTGFSLKISKNKSNYYTLTFL